MKCSAIVLAVAAVVAAAGCKKEDKGKPAAQQPAPVTAGKVEADGTRRVVIDVKSDGYHPAAVEARPGEKLKLAFTRVEDTECGAQVKVDGVESGKVYDLPMNTPVEIAVTAPASGSIQFACGMDMMTGLIVVK